MMVYIEIFTITIIISINCSIGRKDAACMKKRLKEFIKKETEKLQGSSSIRLEARYCALHEVANSTHYSQ